MFINAQRIVVKCTSCHRFRYGQLRRRLVSKKDILWIIREKFQPSLEFKTQVKVTEMNHNLSCSSQGSQFILVVTDFFKKKKNMKMSLTTRRYFGPTLSSLHQPQIVSSDVDFPYVFFSSKKKNWTGRRTNHISRYENRTNRFSASMQC